MSANIITKATREPLIGFSIDWIIEEGTNIFLGTIERGKQTDKYPYNQIFEIQTRNQQNIQHKIEKGDENESHT